ncbi:MAG: hypothetical protein HC808_15400 [Candidatus Competibacteraceae bacterium]|nr:hypothetical protein [Candidatus Competibacteraceae bacterium]
MRILGEVVRMNRALTAKTEQAAQAGQFNAAIERIKHRAKHDCLVCSISDGFGVDDTTRRLVTQICAHNDVIAVFVYDPLERELADSGRLVFADARGQIEIDSTSRQLRQRFTESFEERLDWIEQLAQQHTIPLLPIHTEAPVAEQVRDLLGYHTPTKRV